MFVSIELRVDDVDTNTIYIVATKEDGQETTVGFLDEVDGELKIHDYEELSLEDFQRISTLVYKHASAKISNGI